MILMRQPTKDWLLLQPGKVWFGVFCWFRLGGDEVLGQVRSSFRLDDLLNQTINLKSIA
jgi:hypothetical protein